MGIAASMGQFLLSAGTRGKRFALPHTRILMHQGSAGIQGTAVDVQLQAENLEHTKSVMNRLIAEHTGQELATIARDADRDRWFTAEQARDYGFVDRVLESVPDIRPAADRSASGRRDHGPLHRADRGGEDPGRRTRGRCVQPVALGSHRLPGH